MEALGEGVELGLWGGVAWGGGGWIVGMGWDEGLVAHTLGLHFAGDGVDGGVIEVVELFEHAVEEEAVAEDVDLARDAVGGGVDLGIGAIGDLRIGAPIDELDAVLDVLAGLVGGERSQMIGGDDALAELGEVVGGEDVAELGLAQEAELDGGDVVDLEVGEHAELFQGAHGEVLDLVDDDEDAAAAALIVEGEALQVAEQGGLVDAAGVDAEGGGDHAQRVVGLDLGGDELGGEELGGIELGEEMADEGGLAGADLAGDDDEALALVQAVLQIGDSLLMAGGAKEEARVGAELERLAAQLVEVVIHGI